jgi:hypothetical protein
VFVGDTKEKGIFSSFTCSLFNCTLGDPLLNVHVLKVDPLNRPGLQNPPLFIVVIVRRSLDHSVALTDYSRIAFVGLVSCAQPVRTSANDPFAAVHKLIADQQWTAALASHNQQAYNGHI